MIEAVEYTVLLCSSRKGNELLVQHDIVLCGFIDQLAVTTLLFDEFGFFV